MSRPQEFPGLDYDFMRYMGVKPQVQREIQSHYLPYFENRKKVLDLACGDGDFVAMLHERQIDVTGVDSEPQAVKNAQKLGLPVVESDVFDYLDRCAENSYDAIFCAHLVEHLPYPQVMELIDHAYRILEPGGIIVLATPNARALVSHLEMFYMHYDHVNFFHPRLLCFFLERGKFVNAEEGVNPFTGSPLMAELHHMSDGKIQATPPAEVLDGIRTYYKDNSEIQSKADAGSNTSEGNVGILRKLVRSTKDAVAYLFVRPYLDKLALNSYLATHKLLEHIAIQAAQQQKLAHDIKRLQSALTSLNGPFECYALAYKPQKD